MAQVKISTEDYSLIEGLMAKTGTALAIKFRSYQIGYNLFQGAIDNILTPQEVKKTLIPFCTNIGWIQNCDEVLSEPEYTDSDTDTETEEEAEQAEQEEQEEEV